MKSEWTCLISEFKYHEEMRGVRSSRKIPYILKPFFVYLENYGYELNEIDYKKAQDYQTYLATLEKPDESLHYSSNAMIDLMVVIRSFYGFLKRKKLVFSNPFNSVRNGRKEKRMPRNIPKEETLSGFLDSLKCFWKEPTWSRKRHQYKIHVIAELMYSTGLRLSEVANLRVDDIDFEEKIVHVRNGKGGKNRKAYLNEYAARVLKIFIHEMREHVNCKNDSPQIFGVKDGRNLEPAINHLLKEKGEAFELGDFTSHKFRHSLGFHLLRNGCPFRFIQEILGHDDYRATSLYTKVDKSDMKNELDTHHPRQFKNLKE